MSYVVFVVALVGLIVAVVLELQLLWRLRIGRGLQGLRRRRDVVMAAYDALEPLFLALADSGEPQIADFAVNAENDHRKALEKIHAIAGVQAKELATVALPKDHRQAAGMLAEAAGMLATEIATVGEATSPDGVLDAVGSIDVVALSRALEPANKEIERLMAAMHNGVVAPASDSSGEPRERKQSLLSQLVELVVMVLLAFGLAQVVRTFLIQPYVIPTGSMIPTIQIADQVLADKLSFRFEQPHRGDIVVLDDPTGETPLLIKRVIAVGGQTVDLKDGRVVVDGVALDEPYTYGQPSFPLGGSTITFPVVMPPNTVWVMGDN
ncbi:MAG TPA: signal peptidase I, partial [Coriobacteriia bacterium]